MTTVQYGSHPRQTYLHYERGDKPALVFIHGGAWRDASNTMHDFDKWGVHLCNFNVFSLDYRLAPEYQHPSQLNDIIASLEMILKSINGPVTLCGHSVGATLICQLIETGKFNGKIKKLILMDGIYSIRDLIERYPDYGGFVLEEFKDLEVSYTSTFIDKGLSSEIYNEFEICLVHSDEDELLSWDTTQVFIDWIRNWSSNVNIKVIRGRFGTHNEVYENIQVADRIINTK